MNTNLLNSFLLEASKGNSEASYNAGKLMAEEGKFNDVTVQLRYMDAANAGCVSAQKELGALGLCGRLITDDATAYNISYNTDYEKAIDWLKKAAANGDSECKVVVLAIEKFGTKVIENARKDIEIYTKTISCDNLKSSTVIILFKIAMQYLAPIELNKRP